MKGYAAHEKGVFEEVTRARAGLQKAARRATTSPTRPPPTRQLQGALVNLNAVAENYPELQANENFLDLQRQLAETENQLSFSRQYYNDAVAKLNTLTRTLPWLLFTGISGVHSGSSTRPPPVRTRRRPCRSRLSPPVTRLGRRALARSVAPATRPG